MQKSISFSNVPKVAVGIEKVAILTLGNPTKQNKNTRKTLVLVNILFFLREAFLLHFGLKK